jgi:DNA polymerase III alpha subunit (gram-positive type)
MKVPGRSCSYYQSSSQQQRRWTKCCYRCCGSCPPPSSCLPTEENDINIDWGSVLYVVLDLETTGRSRQRDEIIKLAAVVLDESGVEIEDVFFS